MNKQLIIHVAAELIIISTVTFLFHRRISKIENYFQSLDKQNHDTKVDILLKRIEFLENTVHAMQNQIKQLSSFSTSTPNLSNSNLNKQFTSKPVQQNSNPSFLNPKSIFNPLSMFEQLGNMMPMSIPNIIITNNKNNNTTPDIQVMPDDSKISISDDVESNFGDEEKLVDDTLN